jgi:hypothetical protein
MLPVLRKGGCLTGCGDPKVEDAKDEGKYEVKPSVCFQLRNRLAESPGFCGGAHDGIRCSEVVTISER